MFVDVFKRINMGKKKKKKVKKVCSMQEGQLLLCWFFYPNKHIAYSFTFTRHLFLLLFLNMYTHKFKAFANIVYLVQTMRSEVLLDDFDKNKKNK